MVAQSYHADRWCSLLPGNVNRDVCVFPRILRVSAARPERVRLAPAAAIPRSAPRSNAHGTVTTAEPGAKNCLVTRPAAWRRPHQISGSGIEGS